MYTPLMPGKGESVKLSGKRASRRISILKGSSYPWERYSCSVGLMTSQCPRGYSCLWPRHASSPLRLSHQGKLHKVIYYFMLRVLTTDISAPSYWRFRYDAPNVLSYHTLANETTSQVLASRASSFVSATTHGLLPLLQPSVLILRSAPLN